MCSVSQKVDRAHELQTSRPDTFTSPYKSLLRGMLQNTACPHPRSGSQHMPPKGTTQMGSTYAAHPGVSIQANCCGSAARTRGKICPSSSNLLKADKVVLSSGKWWTSRFPDAVCPT